MELGVIGRPHGVRGDVRLWPHNSRTGLLEAGRTLSVGAHQGTVRDLTVKRIRRDAKGPIVTFEGIFDRDVAKTLTGQRWFESRDDFPALASDEIYIADLIGLRARLEDGSEIGEVAEVWTATATDIIVIRDGEREHLVPNVAEFVRRMDLEKGEIVIRPIEGLLAE